MILWFDIVGEDVNIPLSDTDIRFTQSATQQAEEKLQAYFTKEYSARTDILQKKGFTLEINCLAPEKPSLPFQDVEIVITQSGARRNLKELMPQVTRFIEADELIVDGPMVVQDSNTIIFPKTVTIPRGKDSFHGLKKTANSLVQTYRTDDGKILEGHRFLALEGSLVAFAHEDGHLKRRSDMSQEEQVHLKAIRRKVESPGYLPNGVTEQDYRDYVEFHMQNEGEAWIEGFMLVQEVREKRNIDLSEGMNPIEVLDLMHSCLTTYEDFSQAMKNALEQRAEQQEQSTEQKATQDKTSINLKESTTSNQ